jgi:hypothetical protein
VRRVAVILAAAALLAGAPEARAQKDVGDPLEHFLGTAAPGRAERTLDDGVARAVGDFNDDGLADVALWQESDFGPYHGPVFLYLGRKDGRFAAAGTIVASPGTLFEQVPVDAGRTRLIVCDRGGGRETVANGYAIDGFIVSDLPREALPRKCPRAEGFVVERLDVKRYRENGMQAWISR